MKTATIIWLASIALCALVAGSIVGLGLGVAFGDGIYQGKIDNDVLFKGRPAKKDLPAINVASILGTSLYPDWREEVLAAMVLLNLCVLLLGERNKT